MLFQTGLRISEALSLTVGHLSRQPGALEVLGKGSKLRLVACPAPLMHRLKAFVTGQGVPDPSAFYTAHTMPVKCNESLREDYCRWFTTRERNCEGNPRAQRYGMAHLFHALRDLYSSEIVITGEPALKPYDQCFLYDSYNDMHGVFEVEQVTHIFSSETGFVTCIVPDLMVQCNELASMSTTDALGAYFMAGSATRRTP